jgi:hypothetical protein
MRPFHLTEREVRDIQLLRSLPGPELEMLERLLEKLSLETPPQVVQPSLRVVPLR